MKLIFALTFFMFSLFGFTQESNYMRVIQEIRNERNREMKDTAESPLKKSEINRFVGLNFFAIDSNYRVKVNFTRLKNEKKFLMKTSGSKTPEYIKYGYISFELNGKKHQLFLYQNIALSKTKEHKNHLFLPFTDNTNGKETYGGGRYIDLEIPKSKSFYVDFNLCYNPYCAYTTGYNCPIVPAENYLDTEVKAGEKILWEEH